MDKNKSGGLFTDKDYIEEFGLDPALEGTEAINKAMRDYVMKATERDLVKKGNVSAQQAPHLAKRMVK